MFRHVVLLQLGLDDEPSRRSSRQLLSHLSHKCVFIFCGSLLFSNCAAKCQMNPF